MKKAFEEDVMPDIERFVPVAFVKVALWREVDPRTVKVEVTVEEDATNPPRSCRVAVATAPRLDTVSSVSDSAPAEGQPVPFERQIFCPATVAVANVPTSLYK